VPHRGRRLHPLPERSARQAVIMVPATETASIKRGCSNRSATHRGAKVINEAQGQTTAPAGTCCFITDGASNNGRRTRRGLPVCGGCAADFRHTQAAFGLRRGTPARRGRNFAGLCVSSRGSLQAKGFKGLKASEDQSDR